MALGLEQRLGGLPVFTREDFEGAWRPVAGGGFGQVFQARHRRWRTQYAIKCAPCLLPDTARYLWARPPIWQEELRAGAPQGERDVWVRRGGCPLAFPNSSQRPGSPGSACLHPVTACRWHHTCWWNPEAAREQELPPKLVLLLLPNTSSFWVSGW